MRREQRARASTAVLTRAIVSTVRLAITYRKVRESRYSWGGIAIAMRLVMKTIKMMMFSPLLLSTLAACTADPELQTVPPMAACVGYPNCGAVVQPACPGPNCGSPVPVHPNCAPVIATGPLCDIDTRQVVQSEDGHLVEVVTSHGRLFEFENGTPIQPDVNSIFSPVPAPAVAATPVGAAHIGTDLSSIPLYALGPCAGRPGPACVFDTHAFVLLPEGRFLEYVTVDGRQWVF